MSSRLLRLALVAVCAATFAVASFPGVARADACSDATNSGNTCHGVEITAAGFKKNVVTVSVGDVVVWEDNAGDKHTVTPSPTSPAPWPPAANPASPAAPAGSGDLHCCYSDGNNDPTTFYEVTFTAAGTYTYFDTHNASMTGTVLVNDPNAGTAPDSSSTTTTAPPTATTSPDTAPPATSPAVTTGPKHNKGTSTTTASSTSTTAPSITTTTTVAATITPVVTTTPTTSADPALTTSPPGAPKSTPIAAAGPTGAPLGPAHSHVGHGGKMLAAAAAGLAALVIGGALWKFTHRESRYFAA